MKFLSITGLLGPLACTLLACGAVADVAPQKDQPVAVEQAPARPIETDAGVSTPPPPTECSPPLVDPKCGTTKPAPTTTTTIASFVKKSAVPLRCDAAGNADVWDVRPLVQLYGKQKMFMMGEVHGTNEIGIMSSLVFEQLASQKLVNVVAFEMPMDLEPALQRYLDTGKDPMAQQIIQHGSPNMFGTILTKTARALVVKGIPLRIGAVDIPYDPQTAVHAIQEVATKLTVQKNAVLATLPTSNAEPPGPADIAAANTYFDHIMANKSTICSELSVADCDRLVAMTHALWASTLSGDRGDDQLWFARREEVIYYNLRTKMAAPTDRMFLHMGAFHTNKGAASAGSRMAHEYALTKDQVFSVAPAYGDGSVIWYGEDMDLPGAPGTIVSALSHVPAHPFFVSTTRPSASCESNPLGEEPEDSVGGGTRGELYDGYIHYGKLTSEQRPEDTTFTLDSELGGGKGNGKPAIRSLGDFRLRIQQREQRAFAH